MMIRSLMVGLMSLAPCASAQTPTRTVARVVSIEGAAFTIEVLEGGVSDGEKLELWSPSGKKSVTVSVPGSGFVERGRTVEGISCQGGTPVPRAVFTRPGQVTSWPAAQAAVAAFPPKVLARVVSVEGATVTLECLEGALANGQPTDVLMPTGVSAASVRLPPGVDLMLKGDRLKGVSLGTAATPGALLSDRARFASLAEVGPLSGSAPAPSQSPTPAFKQSSTACVFTPAEIKATLGIEVGPGEGTEFAFEGGSSFSCNYTERKGLRRVTVNRTVMTRGAPAVNAKSHRAMVAGRLESVEGDPDGAAWQVDQGDLTDVTLHYWRNNTGTEVRIGGVVSQGAAAISAMRKNVLKLRRP